MTTNDSRARRTDSTGQRSGQQDRRAASGSLWEACEALLSSHADDASLQRALESLRTAFDCDGVALHLATTDGTLQPWASVGAWERSVGDLRPALGVPLFRGEEKVGALDLLAKAGQRWTPQQRALVRTASGALGAALGAHVELERLRRQPGRDEVTGLADARAFQARLIEEMARAEEEGTALGVVLLGLDHFGAVNEKHGERTGDHVLAECALTLKLAVRDGDFLARLEGDVFAVVLPGCDLAPARRLADRLRHTLETHRFPRVGHLTVSAGASSAPIDAMDAHELHAAAERALGLAKKAGRQRTRTSAPASSH
jgi:diguanylate cyclase (GGDEF)-like protein